MPTAGRLTGAIVFAGLCGLLAWMMLPLFPEGRPPSRWFLLCIGVGIVTGWAFVGARAGQRTGAAIGTGLSAAAVLAFWVLFITGGRDMIADSMRGRFDGPTEAVVSVFGYMLDTGRMLAEPAVLFMLVMGSVVAALFTNLIGSRYR